MREALQTALEALEKLAKLGNEPYYGNSIGNQIALDAISSINAALADSDKAATLDLEEYDAGLLGDYGGGNIEWWQDYLRSELNRAYEFYQDQAKAFTPPQRKPLNNSNANAPANCPEEIYLVFGDLELCEGENPQPFQHQEYFEITWCENKEYANDCKYVRADLVPLSDDAEKSVNAELLEALEAWRMAEQYSERYADVADAKDDINEAWNHAVSLRNAAIAKATGEKQC